MGNCKEVEPLNYTQKKSGDILNINGKKYEVIKHEIDTFYETKTETRYRKGQDIVHEVEVVKEIPANVDTASILKDYYALFSSFVFKFFSIFICFYL